MALPREGYNPSGGLAEGYEEVYDPYTGKRKAKRRRLGGNLGTSGSFSAMPEDNPLGAIDQSAIKDMISLQLSDAMNKRQTDPEKTRSGLFGVDWGSLFGGGDDPKKKGSGLFGKDWGDTNWSKWATFGKGLMDYQTSGREFELGKMQNRQARDLLDFKKSSYLGDVARQDKVFAQNQQTADQKKFYLGKWLEAQGRGAEKPQYFDKDFELGNLGAG